MYKYVFFCSLGLWGAENMIDKPAQPNKFLEAVGQRGMILGSEDGRFEAWLNPIKILRDFQISVYIDGAMEPTPLAGLAERVNVTAARSQIVFGHAAFAITESWLADPKDPLLYVLLEVDTRRPLKLRVSFTPEMKPMWPASFGGQSSSYSAEDHAMVFNEGLRRFHPVMGSPLFARASEQIGHQLPDRTVLIEMDVPPEHAGPIPILITDSMESYRKEVGRWKEHVQRATAFYRDFDSRTLRVETPDPVLNRAFRWAKYALEKGWACNEGVGCGLVAGFAPSGLSERPGFAWYFGGDALMNSWSILDYSDHARVRALLEFLRAHQRADGKIPHELTQSLTLLDWSQYPYGYYHADTTPHFLLAMSKYLFRSGDKAFLGESWDSIQRAYQQCVAGLDESGLLSNRKAGAGAVETGALSGKVANDVYLQGVWIAGLEGYVRMAGLLGKDVLEAQGRLDRARRALNSGWFTPKGQLAFARLTDGSVYDAQSSWQAMALAYAGLDEGLTRRAVAGLGRSELSTAWGTRLFATDSPFYDPLSYNDGSVWPFVTQFAMMAEFRYGRPELGLKTLAGVAGMTGHSGAGWMPEYFSGERPYALPHSVPHQLFSSAAVVHPLVSGLLGLEGDAIEGVLHVNPKVPKDWVVTFSNYRVGSSLVSGEIRDGKARVTVTGPGLKIVP